MRVVTPNCCLFRGDCFEHLPNIPDRSIHTVITDHPYGSTDCHWDQVVDLSAWWREINRVTVETSIVACFAAQPFATDLINSNRKSFRYELVWDKVAPVGFLNANKQPMRVHELLLIFSRRPGKSVYNPQKTPGKPYISQARADSASVYRTHGARQTINTGWRHPVSILRHSKPSSRHRLHPTEKPLSLCEWLVLSYSRPGTTILDTFMGSAPVGHAALKHDRRFIGIERDESIFATAKKRLHPLMNVKSRQQNQA